MSDHEYTEHELRNALSFKEACSRLDVSRTKMYELIREGQIVPIRVGAGKGRYVFPERCIADYYDRLMRRNGGGSRRQRAAPVEGQQVIFDPAAAAFIMEAKRQRIASSVEQIWRASTRAPSPSRDDDDDDTTTPPGQLGTGGVGL